MVDSFSSAKPYSFEIDGKAYTLPGLSFGDIDIVAEALSGTPEVQLAATRSIIFDRANVRTQTAIKSLSIGDLGSLFRKWAGLDKGESEASDD